MKKNTIHPKSTNKLSVRNGIYVLSLVMGVFLIHCGFSSSFEQIEENRVRTIDFTYRNCADTTLCEASPGDSMEITALFAGEKVTDIALSVSFNVQLSIYGIYSAFDSLPLDYIIMKSSLQSPGTDADTFTFRFRIPDSILATSSFLPEHNWADVFPEALRSQLPSSFTSMKKSQIIAELDSLSNQSARPDSIFGFPFTSFRPFAETILQIFTAPVELRALVNKKYEIVSYCSVRYNRRLHHFDNKITCNHNPLITRMGIYRVYQNNLTYFDPSKHTQRHDTIVLYDKENIVDNREYTLHIEKDESYFLFAQSDTPQETYSISGLPVKETHYFEWFYQQDFTGNDLVSTDEQMALLSNADGPIIPLHPASTRSIDHSGIWVQVRDAADGPRLYPTGSSVFRTNIFFTYSDEYIKKQEVLK
jgi:hypothetical protein